VSRFKSETAGQGEGSLQVSPAPATTNPRRAAAWTVFVLLLGALLVYGVDQLSRPAPAIQQPATKAPVRPAKTDRAIAERASSRVVSPAAPALTASQEAGQPIPTGQVFGAQNSSVRVVIRARAATRVLVQGFGGKVYINRLLHPGDVYRVPNLVGLSLTTPDGGAVALELDGQDAGVAGPSGQMMEALSLDPRAVVDRHGGGIGTEHNKVIQ
jgi:cytoskeleton protein RodZ